MYIFKLHHQHVHRTSLSLPSVMQLIVSELEFWINKWLLVLPFQSLISLVPQGGIFQHGLFHSLL